MDRPGAHGVNSLSGLRGYGEKQLTMTPGDLALNLEAGRDKRKNQPQRSVQVNILSLWRNFLFQVPNAGCQMLGHGCRNPPAHRGRPGDRIGRSGLNPNLSNLRNLWIRIQNLIKAQRFHAPSNSQLLTPNSSPLSCRYGENSTISPGCHEQ